MRCTSSVPYKVKLNLNLIDMAKRILPKVQFIYSWIYDDVFKKFDRPPKNRNLSFRAMQRYIKSVEALWRKREKAILQELSKVAKLSWKEEKIPCYVITYGLPFSNPLTIGVWEEEDYFLDILTHELIHRLFFQEGNEKRIAGAWRYFLKKYKQEPFETRTHIPLRAFHEHIFRTLFNEKRLQREYEITKRYSKEEKRSWDIVREEGYKNIIKQFVDRIR